MSQIDILFLCTGNSARSILAEAIANQLYGHRIRACSAGTNPGTGPHPLALDLLREEGLSTDDLLSEPVSAHQYEHFDLIVTLCDSARSEPCPVLPGEPPQVHWNLPDPPAADDPEATFRAVYETLHYVIGLIAESTEDVVSTARRAAAEVSNRIETV